MVSAHRHPVLWTAPWAASILQVRPHPSSDRGGAPIRDGIETVARVLCLALVAITAGTSCAPDGGGRTSPETDPTTEVLRSAVGLLADRAPRDTVYLSPRWNSGQPLETGRLDALLAGEYPAPVARWDSSGPFRGFSGAVIQFSEPRFEQGGAALRGEVLTVFNWDRTHNYVYRLKLASGERGWLAEDVELVSIGDGVIPSPDHSSRQISALRVALRHAADSIPGGDRYVHTFLSSPDSATSRQEIAARILDAELISRRKAVPCPSSGECSMSVPGPVVGIGPVDFTGPGRARATVGWRTDADLDAPGYEYDELDVWLEESADGSWRVVRSRVDPGK